MSGTDETQLLARIRERDTEALAVFIELRRRQLHAYIQRKLGAALRSRVEPDDIFQEVSTTAVRDLPGYDLGERDPFGWLCQLVDRRIVDAHRRLIGSKKRSAEREVPLGGAGEADRRALIDLLVASLTSPSEQFARNQRGALLLDALEKLSPDWRDALRMRYAQRLPTKVIAERMGKTDGAVRVMLTRALDRLQELLGPDVAP